VKIDEIFVKQHQLLCLLEQGKWLDDDVSTTNNYAFYIQSYNLFNVFQILGDQCLHMLYKGSSTTAKYG
jgi:hypothetical protein